MDWTHGGDWAGFELEYGEKPLDFSANVSPLGLPEGVRLAAARALQDSAAYPDPHCRGLRRALAAQLDLPERYILCGNGASDLIYRLCGAARPRRALITAPAFSEYETALALYGCEVRRFPLREENGFRLTEDFLDRIAPGTELVFLGNPNNPTGRTVEPGLLMRIRERCRAVGALLAVDECFLEFLDAPEAHTLLPQLEMGGLLLFRAFTKFYGMAGLRLGCCLCGDGSLLRRMAQAGPPWPVSNVAQAAGVAALRETDYALRLRELIRSERPVLAAGLAGCGCRVIPGEANYLLFFSPDGKLGEKLKSRGILIRDCREYHGLGPGWFRAAVRTREENDILITAMGEVLR